MSSFRRLAAAPVAALLASAAPGPTMIPNPKYPNHILIIPHDSPVKFRAWDEDGVANFEGKSELSGTWSYGCAIECSDLPDETYYEFDLFPDPAIAARLPRWNSSGDISVVITDEERLVRSAVEPRLRAALRAEKVPYVTGRISIIVDNYRTGFSCDSPFYSARFVAIAKQHKLARAGANGISSCGA